MVEHVGVFVSAWIFGAVCGAALMWSRYPHATTEKLDQPQRTPPDSAVPTKE